jgi:hypothetical protein
VGRPEAGVSHRERREEARAQNLGQRHPGGAGEQHAEHRRAGVVEPALARLREQRQGAEARDPGVGVGLGGWVGRADGSQVQIGLGGCHHRPRSGRHKHLRHHPEAEGERQQIARRDGARRRHRVLERSVGAAQHAPVGELREQPVDRLVEGEEALVDERERGRRRDRLRRRGDPEDRVAPHRRAADRELAERLDVNVPAARHEGDEAGNPAGADVRSGGCRDPLHARLCQAFGHGGRRLSLCRAGDLA